MAAEIYRVLCCWNRNCGGHISASAMYVLNTGRMEAGNSVPALYPLSYYGRLAGDFFCVDYTSPGSRYYTVLGLVPLLLAAVFVLLVKRKKTRI